MRHRRNYNNRNDRNDRNSGGGGGGGRRHGRSRDRRHNNNNNHNSANHGNNNDSQRSHSPRNNNGGNGGFQQQSVLPSPEILQEYEYASEGTVARLMEMAEVEQDRRNAWEDEYSRYYKKSLRLGQFFGFILLLSVVWGTIQLGSIGQKEVAIALSVSAFSAVALASLFSEIGRRLSRRPRRFR